jgi:OOP family OmpA-OmpF porin
MRERKESIMAIWKKGLIAGVIGASFAVSAPGALAQGLKLSGWYLGGSLGQSEMGDIDCPPVAGAKCDDKDKAWRIFGGYQINRTFAVELGYTDLGSFDRTAPGINATIEATAWDIVGIAAFPLGNTFSLYGKLGFYRSETEAQALGDQSNNDFTYGAGIQWDFTPNFAMRAEWQRYQSVEFKRATGTGTGDGDVDVLSVGALVKF